MTVTHRTGGSLQQAENNHTMVLDCGLAWADKVKASRLQSRWVLLTSGSDVAVLTAHARCYALIVEKIGNKSRPPRLVRGTKPLAGVAVKILVEQQVVIDRRV